MGWMYILECADGTYYVGSTRDLARRLAQHQAGEGAKYTARRLPMKLVFSAEFSSIAEVFACKKQVQGWSRAKREALINGEYHKLPSLARKDWEKYHERKQQKTEAESLFVA